MFRTKNGTCGFSCYLYGNNTLILPLELQVATAFHFKIIHKKLKENGNKQSDYRL